jgi:hypothetical protein
LRTGPLSTPNFATTDKIASSEERPICVPAIRIPRSKDIERTVVSNNDQKDLWGV